MAAGGGMAFALITKLDRASSLRVRIARANFRERTRLRESIRYLARDHSWRSRLAHSGEPSHVTLFLGGSALIWTRGIAIMGWSAKWSRFPRQAGDKKEIQRNGGRGEKKERERGSALADLHLKAAFQIKMQTDTVTKWNRSSFHSPSFPSRCVHYKIKRKRNILDTGFCLR
jgi:hypothetical protein